MDFIETPISTKLPARVGRAKMPNTSTNEAPKASRKYAKTRGEHLKDMIIVALVAGLIAFIGGMHFSNGQHSQVERAVTAATAVKK